MKGLYMKSREYLQRIRDIDAILRMYEEEITRAREKAEAIGGASFGGDKVTKSHVIHDKMAESVAQYVDLQADYIKKSAALERERHSIIFNIHRLPEDEAFVLYGVYVKGQTLQEVSTAAYKSYSTISSKHLKALADLQKLIDEEGIENNRSLINF